MDTSTENSPGVQIDIGGFNASTSTADVPHEGERERPADLKRNLNLTGSGTGSASFRQTRWSFGSAPSTPSAIPSVRPTTLPESTPPTFRRGTAIKANPLASFFLPINAVR